MIKFGNLSDIARLKSMECQMTLDGKVELVGIRKLSTKDNNGQVGLFEALAMPKYKIERS